MLSIRLLGISIIITHLFYTMSQAHKQSPKIGQYLPRSTKNFGVKARLSNHNSRISTQKKTGHNQPVFNNLISHVLTNDGQSR